MSMCTQAVKSPIINLDRACMRIVNNLKFTDHVSHLYKKFGILTVPELIRHYIVKFMFKNTKNFFRDAFSDCWPKVRDRVNMRNLRNNDLFDIPNNLAYDSLKRFPLYSFPTAYNDIPDEIKNCSKIGPFISQSKKFILGEGGERPG